MELNTFFIALDYFSGKKVPLLPKNKRELIDLKYDLPSLIVRRFHSVGFTNQYHSPAIIPYISKSERDGIFSSVQLAKYQNSDIDLTSIYPCSNDEINVRTKNNRPQVYVATGNLTSLDILSHLEPKYLYFLDINPSQLEHLKLVINLIQESKTRAEFVSRYLGKKESDVKSVLKLADSSKEVAEIENQFWQSEDDIRPYSELHSEMLDYEYVDNNGLRGGAKPVKYGQDVIGGVNLIMTFRVRGRNKIDGYKTRHGCFPIYRPDGFLRSEEAYDKTRRLLLEKNWILIPEPFTADLLHLIANNHSYHELHLWLSNILNSTFFGRLQRDLVEKINYLRYYSSSAYNIQIWEDDRDAFYENSYVDFRTPHWDAFAVVNSYLYGKTIELVPTNHMAESPSPLPNTTKIKPDSLTTDLEPDCIFYHILMGHGMEQREFRQIVEYGMEIADRVIILEHNRLSNDFTKEIGTTAEALINMFGEPTSISYSVGKSSSDRNIIAIYE